MSRSLPHSSPGHEVKDQDDVNQDSNELDVNREEDVPALEDYSSVSPGNKNKSFRPSQDLLPIRCTV